LRSPVSVAVKVEVMMPPRRTAVEFAAGDVFAAPVVAVESVFWSKGITK
jgi:hypothetical protein